MAIISAIYFLAGRERTAMRASLTPTLTTPHVCLMADPRSLPGLLTICGGLTSRYPITAHRVPAWSFLFIVSRIRPGVSPLFAPLVTYADQFCHSRDAFVPEKLSRFYYFFFPFFFSPAIATAPPWICIVTLYIWYTRKWRNVASTELFFNGKSPRCSSLVVVAATAACYYDGVMDTEQTSTLL